MKYIALILAIVVHVGAGFVFVAYKEYIAQILGGVQSNSSGLMHVSFLSFPQINSDEESRAQPMFETEQNETDDGNVLADVLLEEKIIHTTENRPKLPLANIISTEEKIDQAEAAKLKKEDDLQKKESSSPKTEVLVKTEPSYLPKKEVVTARSNTANITSPKNQLKSTSGKTSQEGKPTTNPSIGKNQQAGFGASTSESAMMNSIAGYIQKCYPAISRRRGEEGVAVIAIVVAMNNHVSNVKLLQSTGFSRLDQCAISAVNSAARNHQFISALRNGKRVQGEIRLKPIRFRLN